MPKTNSQGSAKQSELPTTLRRSDAKAQRTFAKAHDSALEQYGDETRANRVAYDALKHTHQKVGNKWEPKDRSGPSDAQSKGGASTSRSTAGGVNAYASKQELYDQASELGIAGRSTMTKAQLVDALEKESKRSTKATGPGA